VGATSAATWWGWAQEPERTYRALNRLIGSPDAPPGMIANTQMNIGYSHLLVGNVDLACVYLEEAWRRYAPAAADAAQAGGGQGLGAVPDVDERLPARPTR